ncbi:MAG: hypothetical protein ACC645_09135 [Pirellulales bacterium]
MDRCEEEAKTADDYFDVLERLIPIHRAARNLYQALQEARKLCPDYRDVIDLRDRAYTIERMADLLFIGTKHSLDSTVAKRAEQQADSSRRMAVAAHRLNLLAAFFFPIITLAAIFGIDFATVAAVFGIDYDTAVAKGYVPLFFLGAILCCLVTGGILTSLVYSPPPPPNERGKRTTADKVR